jgi:hypothetical protein
MNVSKIRTDLTLRLSFFSVCLLIPSGLLAQEDAVGITQPATEQNLVADQQLDAERKVVAKFEADARKCWEAKIQELEALDQSEQHPADSVLFVGSSSIRLWDSIEEDMAPYRPIRRGYGGARYSDLAVFADRLISPHECKAVVIFVANDVSGGDIDRTPEEVGLLVQNILRTTRDKKKSTPIFMIEVTPTRARFPTWEKIREVNARLREICLTTPNTYFIATAEHYLDSDKQPIEELFVEDRLHLNDAGYDLWGSLIKRRLDDVVGHECAATEE